MRYRVLIAIAALTSAGIACNAASLLTSEEPVVIDANATIAAHATNKPVEVAAPETEATLLPTSEAVEDEAETVDRLQMVDSIVATPMVVATISAQTAVPTGNDVRTAEQDDSSAAPPTEMQALAETVFGDNLPVKLEITTLDVATDVIAVGWRTSAEGVQWDSPKNAAGFVINSAAPGNVGNTVIYGHNNIEGEVFKNLSDVEAGDEIKLTAEDGTVYLYEVEEVVRFQEQGITADQRLEHLSYFDPTQDQRLTLLTCWPYTGNSHRVAVVAKPTS